MKTLLESQKNIKQTISFLTKSVDNENFIVEGEFSHEIEDRQGDVVVQNGWNLENYKRNPVVLWAHDHSNPPIAKMLDISVNAQNILTGKMQFAVNEYPFAATIFKLIAGGYQRAFSVGFNNNKWQMDEQDDKLFLLENELFEVSAVPVGADQLALAKQKGIDIENYEKFVVQDEIVANANKTIETLQSTIKALTEALNAIGNDNQGVKKVEHPEQSGAKKIPVAAINKAVRALLNTKKKL